VSGLCRICGGDTAKIRQLIASLEPAAAAASVNKMHFFTSAPVTEVTLLGIRRSLAAGRFHLSRAKKPRASRGAGLSHALNGSLPNKKPLRISPADA
jgi:hypothetical protein